MPWNNQGAGGNQGGTPSNNGSQGNKNPGAGGPWGGAGGPGGGKEPPATGPRPSPGGGGEPGPGDLEALLKRSRDRMRTMLPPGMRQGNWLGLAATAILVLWLLSGFYRVQQDEQAIQMVFGKADPNVLPPGLHYNWPAPVGSVVLSRTGSENRIEVGFSSANRGKAANGSESLMLTGDENIIDIKFVVLWKISDPFKYEFNIRDPEHTITRAAESAIREVIGETPIQSALTEGREEVSTRTQQALQHMLDGYEAGVTINGIELQAVAPPEKVIDAFNDVQRARSDSERLRNEAEAYRNNILPRAKGEAARKQQDAIGYQAEVVNRAEGDASRFKSVLQSYNEAKDVTQKRLYLETMESVLQHNPKVIVDTAASTPIVLPYLPAPAAAPASTPVAGGKN